MRKINFIVLAVLIATLVYGQRNFKGFQHNQFQTFYPEINIIPSDSLYSVYLSYRIPYNRIVFEKDDNVYKAEYSISVEVIDSNSNFVTRQLDDKRLAVNSFEETNSEGIYAEGLIKFNIKKGIYSITPVFTDVNSNIEMKTKK